MTFENLSADVVIVGAGLSGLTAARDLQRSGIDVVVLEARDRVGGKAWAPDLAGHPVDLGAHWLDTRHVRALALAEEFGVQTVRQSTKGRHVMALAGGKPREFTGSVPMRPLTGAVELGLRVLELDAMARRVPSGAPWTASQASAWDGVTLGHWLSRVRTHSARAALLVTSRTVFGADPGEVSLLYALDYFRAGGGLRRLMSFRGGAQDIHLVGGTQQLCQGIADRLDRPVVLESPVRRITRGDGGVEVVADEVTVRADRVIVATSPATLDGVVFEPALPAGRAALQRESPMGAYFKAVLAYDRPWWRDSGRSGTAFSDGGPVQMTVDVGHGGGEGVLAAFVAGEPARRLPRDADAREAVITDAVADLLGRDRAPAPLAYRDVNWTHEEWSLGGPVGLMAPGVMTSHGAHLRPSVDRIHWAGTESATEFPGYLEGAIIAGEDAARAVRSEVRPRRMALAQ